MSAIENVNEITAELQDINVNIVQSGSYNDLSDKPKINGITLQGTKTASDLGLQPTMSSGSGIAIVNNVISNTKVPSWGEIIGDIESQTDLQEALEDIEDEIPEVVDNVSSTSTTNALSANQGKNLNDRINALEGRGRYLSSWNAGTGLPATEPTSLPYTYKAGDYFIVGAVSTTNYKPNGSTYTGVASTAVETESLAVNDTYRFDGTNWNLQKAIVEIEVDEELSTTSTNPVQNRVITNAINAKADSSTTYNKSEVDTALGLKANSADLATVATSGSYNDLNNKPTVDQVYGASSANAQSGIAVASAVSVKRDKSDSYSKTEVDTALGTKANSNDVYTKSQTNNLLNVKADLEDVYTKEDAQAKMYRVIL